MGGDRSRVVSRQQEETGCLKAACHGNPAKEPWHLDANSIERVPFICAGLACVLRVGSSKDDLPRLGQVASATSPSLLFEAVAKVEDSAQATHQIRRKQTRRTWRSQERQRTVASIQDGTGPAWLEHRIPCRSKRPKNYVFCRSFFRIWAISQRLSGFFRSHRSGSSS